MGIHIRRKWSSLQIPNLMMEISWTRAQVSRKIFQRQPHSWPSRWVAVEPRTEALLVLPGRDVRLDYSQKTRMEPARLILEPHPLRPNHPNKLTTSINDPPG